MQETWNPRIELTDKKIHHHFLRMAYDYASVKSEDPITQNAAIIVKPTLDEIIAYGANHFPEGLNPSPEQMLDRKWKYEHIIHAEPAAIYSAARDGRSTKGAVMYMPWVPCTPCAKSIIDSGIKTLIGHKAMIMKTPQRWWIDTDYAINLISRCGVKLFMYDGRIGDVKNVFDGEEWIP